MPGRRKKGRRIIHEVANLMIATDVALDYQGWSERDGSKWIQCVLFTLATMTTVLP